MESAGYRRVLQVDLEVNGLTVAQGGREVTWQVEYPLSRGLSGEVPTVIRLAPQELGGIVPLAMVRPPTASPGSKLSTSSIHGSDTEGQNLSLCMVSTRWLEPSMAIGIIDLTPSIYYLLFESAVIDH